MNLLAITISILFTMALTPRSIPQSFSHARVTYQIATHQNQERSASTFRPGNPITCESFVALIDNAIIESREHQSTYLIIIVRLGPDEPKALSKSRRRDIETYVKRYKAALVVTGEGNRTDGLGEIDIYVAGEWTTAIPVSKKSPSVCLGKVNPFR